MKRYLILFVVLFPLALLSVDRLFTPSLNLYAERATNDADALAACAQQAAPLVAKAETAQLIFEAIAKDRGGPDFMKGHKLVIRDGVDHWALFQMLESGPDECRSMIPADKKCTVTAGSVGLQMHIDKCTGAVSHVHYVR